MATPASGTFPRDYPRLLRAGGLAVWLAVGLPVLTAGRSRGVSADELGAWAAAFVLFGLAFLVTSAASRFDRDRAGALVLLAAQAGAAIALAALPPCYGLEGALLVLVAIHLGGRLSPAAGLLWIAVQSLVLYGTMALHWSMHMGVLLAGAYLPFQLLAFWTAGLLSRETGAREGLARANAELEATRELLVETHRVAERVRIARELHDLLGHHLTALTLNLEAASHLVPAGAEPRSHIEAAKERARSLLGEVREAVRSMREGEGEGEGLRLDAAVRALSAVIPRPAIHLRFAEDLPACDSASAQVLLRCAQEMITNAVRHSDAENLWPEFLLSEGAIEIQARDDGRGAGELRAGNGLAGMRERLEERGGRLAVRTNPGRGFEVTAVLPSPSPLPSAEPGSGGAIRIARIASSA